MSDNNTDFFVKGPGGYVKINRNDKIGLKIAMIFENQCMGVKEKNITEKYGVSGSQLYKIKNAFKIGGSESLREKQKGPSKNYKRTESVVNQIIRMRFLDRDISVGVITQKLKQMGYKISQRSVERTITEYGIQKKTPFVKS